MALTDDYYAVVEAGGTKFICAIIDKDRNIHAQVRIATTSPDETLARVIDFFQTHIAAGYIFKRLGIASFGPLDLNRTSATFGSITKTPKSSWINTPLARRLSQALACQVAVDTDVNAAALAEYKWGAAQGASVAIYITVGTGVGGGVVIDGKPLHGVVHPEIGHMLVVAPAGQKGICPFHQDCVEGLASGPALEKIWGQPSDTLPDDHEGWGSLADVMAQMCHNLMVCYSAQKIIIGGGVMQRTGLIEKIIVKCERSLHEYIMFPDNLSLADIICAPGLGTYSGLLGALALIDHQSA